jgi:hypothetical protein
MTQKDNALKKVKKALEKYSPKATLGETFAARKIFDDGRNYFVLVDLSGGWTILRDSSLGMPNVHGHVSGYSNLAYIATHALAAFGLITEEEAANFRDWFDDEEVESLRKADEDELKRLAGNLGYQISRNEEKPRKNEEK